MNQTHAPPDMRFFSTIREVPGALWDAKIARGHPFKSSAFLSCLEDSFPERRFTYMVLIKGEAVVGLTVLTEEQMDLSLLMPGAVRRFASAMRKLFPSFLSLRLGMVGTFETAQRHWWFDPDRLTAQAFAEALITACDKVCARSMLLLIRDFTARDREDALLQACILDRGFRQGDNHPLAAVELEGLGIEGHLQRLKKKSRQNLRKKLREAEKLGLKLTREHDFRHLIDACYPLYLHRCTRAPRSSSATPCPRYSSRRSPSACLARPASSPCGRGKTD